MQRLENQHTTTPHHTITRPHHHSDSLQSGQLGKLLLSIQPNINSNIRYMEDCFIFWKREDNSYVLKMGDDHLFLKKGRRPQSF